MYISKGRVSSKTVIHYWYPF